MIVYVGDLSFDRGVMTPAASWAHVALPEPVEIEPEEPLAFGECEGCGATIGTGEPMLCDECVDAIAEAEADAAAGEVTPL